MDINLAKVFTATRLPEPLHRGLLELAKHEDRSVSYILRKLVASELAKRGIVGEPRQAGS